SSMWGARCRNPAVPLPRTEKRQRASPTRAIAVADTFLVREARMAGREALGGVLLRRPRHSPRRRADLLRADVAVSDPAAGRLALGAVGRVSGHLQRDRPSPSSSRAGGHVGAAR